MGLLSSRCDLERVSSVVQREAFGPYLQTLRCRYAPRIVYVNACVRVCVCVASALSSSFHHKFIQCTRYVSCAYLGLVTTEWYQVFETQGRADSMWSQWFIKFCDDRQLFTLYPNIGSYALGRNWQERGLHYDGEPQTSDELLTEWKEDIIRFPDTVLYLGWDGERVERPGTSASAAAHAPSSSKGVLCIASILYVVRARTCAQVYCSFVWFHYAVSLHHMPWLTSFGTRTFFSFHLNFSSLLWHVQMWWRAWTP